MLTLQRNRSRCKTLWLRDAEPGLQKGCKALLYRIEGLNQHSNRYQPYHPTVLPSAGRLGSLGRDSWWGEAAESWPKVGQAAASPKHSLISQDSNRIDSGCSPRRAEACNRDGDDHCGCHGNVGGGIVWADVVQQATEQAA